MKEEQIHYQLKFDKPQADNSTSGMISERWREILQLLRKPSSQRTLLMLQGKSGHGV